MHSPLQPAPETPVGHAPAFDGLLLPQARSRLDLPTLAVAVAVLGGFVLLTYYFRDLPLWLAAPLGALCLAWYSSFQHETIHHHPTSSRRLNAALGSAPLALWLPYRIYRVTHRQHHRHGGRDLTDALSDPESFYLEAGAARDFGRLRRLVHAANCTLLGRLTVGPLLSLQRFWSGEARRVWAGDRWRRAVWLRHAVGALLVTLWVVKVCHIPLIVYALGVVYPSMALSHLRSFAEHRSHPDPSLRTITVEAGRLWSLLFLNNNLHVAHHAYPGVSWYELPAVWQLMREASLGRGLVVQRGYAELTRRYGLSPVMAVEQAGPARERMP